MGLTDTALTLAPGETLVLYTDGFTEACAPDGETMFGVERLQQVLGGPRIGLPLEVCAVEAKAAVEHFTWQPGTAGRHDAAVAAPGGGGRQTSLTAAAE